MLKVKICEICGKIKRAAIGELCYSCGVVFHEIKRKHYAKGWTRDQIINAVKNKQQLKGGKPLRKFELSRVYNYIVSRLSENEKQQIGQLHPKVFITNSTTLGIEFEAKIAVIMDIIHPEAQI